MGVPFAMIRLVAFLGNPGRAYERTRHNVGWMVAEALPFAGQLEWKEKFKGLLAAYGSVRLLKPLFYMNRSGESVGACASYYRITPAELLVVHDDMQLDFGEIETRSGGGLAGHNGLKDIARVLSTRDFERLRFGVSRPGRQAPARYVLERFSPHEEGLLPQLLDRAAALIERRLQSDLP